MKGFSGKMGTYKDEKAQKRDRATKKREERRSARQDTREPVQTTSIAWEALHYCLNRVIAAGGALRIGATRDRGAWAIGIYGDGGDPYTEFVRPAEDINEYLTNLGAYFEELTNPPGD